MPNEEFGGNENNTNKPSNPGDNTVDPGDDAKTIAVTRKLLSSSLDGKHYYSSPTITPQWIVIHNTGGGTAESAYSWFNNPSNQYHTSAHYCVDDRVIIQCLEDNWKGVHAGGSGVQYQDKWRPSNSEDCTNSNSIGIEVADWGGDYKGEQFGKAIENAIDLTISLMKKHNIDVNHVIRHGDTQAKDCPHFIMKENKWGYFKEQLSNRTGGSLITNDGSGGSSGGSSGGGYDGNSTFLDILPNQDHRYNIANMEEVTGACLIFLPPYNVCTLDQQTEHFKTWNNWDRKYHYILDPLYDMDANPDDDIPDLTNAKGLDEMNNSNSDDTNNDSNNNDSNNGSDYADPDELPEDNRRTIQPRAPLGPDDMGSGTNTPQQPGDGGDGGGAQLTENDFSAASFVGDSLTVGLGQAVSGINTFATVGQTVGKGRTEHAQAVINKGSRVVIISYGTNDAGYKDTSGFITNYKNLINDIKNGIPGVTIFVNKIFPGDASKANSNGKICIENIPAHNNALNQICSDTGAFLIDCTGIPNLMSYYSSDGIHFKSEFYKLWYEDMKSKVLSHTGGNTSNNGSTGPKAEEDNSIVIKGGFLIETPRLLQCYGLEDNDKATYISRALYNSKPQAHCIMIACFIPTYEDLLKNNTSYYKVERNIINAVSKILWANGLKTEDLWREFDMNRSPSPAIFLNRNHWKDLLSEINKQLIWRNKKFGEVKTKYEKYIAVIPDQTIPSTGGLGGSTPGSGGSGGTMASGNEVANQVYNTLSGLGFTAEAACAVIGNMVQESGLNPTAVNKSSGATGLCQWLGGRLTGLKDYASSKGKEWTDVPTQTEWAWMECEGKDSTTKKLLDKNCGGPEAYKKLTDIAKAVDLWRKCFERCGEHEANDARRLSEARKYLEQVKSGGSSSSDSGTTPALAAIEPRTPQTRTAQFSWPTPGVTNVSSKFGPRTPPCKGASSYHKGIDISAPMNTDVKATAAGTVTFYGFHKSAGNYMVIDHGNGWGSRYLHLSSNVAKKGDQVSANQTIAKSGNTGIGTGAHLHFEILKDLPAGGTSGTAVDPLQYVNPGETVGDPNVGDGSTSSGGGGTGSGGGSVSGPLVNSIWGEIANPGPAANLPYNGNSMGGLEHDDWGGKMSYYVDEAKDPEAEKPEIECVLTDLNYQQFCQQYFEDEAFKEDGTSELTINFNKFWQLIDILTGEQEPYDKGLVNASDAAITPNERLSALTTTFTTDNENVFHFSIIESGPGSKDHCVKAADELNYIITPTDLRVEPIYPDLIIPPQYTTAGYDSNSDNSIPLSLLTEVEGKDFLSKQLSFDYDILNDIKKETNKSFGPVNFMDPYPTDDKIEELEQHYPKVFIDEIESQIYSCNHPGCPIGQPMAKNFAMLSDALMNQSKRTEKRLVRLENILSTIMRNQARLSSRININCVYYGGQSTYAGKYKCIRCMHDDRIHDGAIVTLDQCLNCTRYEPILGQVYQILDETGFNGSIVLDDMQMSYANLDTYKRQNIQSQASPKYNYVSANDDTLTKKPEKDLIEQWKEANKKLYLDSQPEEVVTNIDVELQETENKNTDENQTATTEQQTDPEVEQALESKYIFRMNWNETFLNSQQPDTKQYPTEGIIMRFKKETGDFSFDEEIKELDPEKDKDVIEDLQRQLKLVNGQWTDTRETAETVQINKYSSEKFYFKGFAEIKKTNGLGSSSGGSGSTGAGAECRKLICEMAETIVQECKDGKAWYSQTNRTTDYNKPGYHNGKKAYDCTGFVSCCYMHAGLKSMYAKTAGGGTLMDEIVNNGGEMWLMDDAGFEKAKPGDVLVTATSNVTQADMGKKVSINHAMIYMGDKTIAHAANSKKGIVKEAIEDWRKGKTFFVRPKDLIDADAQAAASGGSSGQVNETEGEVDGKKYVARILGAVCTSYTGSGAGASGMGCEYNKTCASHNLPYGTKIYIPQLADKLGGNGVVTVTDTGGPLFDFDLYTQSNIGKVNADAYVLEWGTGSVAKGYTYFIDYYLKNGQWNTYKSAWNKYKEMGGKLMTFLKFSQEDANIKNHPNYNDK